MYSSQVAHHLQPACMYVCILYLKAIKITRRKLVSSALHMIRYDTMQYDAIYRSA